MSQVRLLHTEIDVVPGRKPQQPTVEGSVGSGAAVVRLTNTTSQENAYTVRVKCDTPYWQEAWCTLAALPPTYGDANLPPTGKADQPGPQNRSVKVFISAGGTRDVQVILNVPVTPDSRAGKYDIAVVVETHIPETGGAA